MDFCFIRTSVGRNAGESGPRNDTGALLKERNHNVAERFNDSKWIAKLIFLGDF